MKSFRWFIVGNVIGIATMGLSYEYYFVMSVEGFLMVPKSQATLENVYLDIREWTLHDWADHPQVARAFVNDGRSDLVSSSVARETVEHLLPDLEDEPDVENLFNLNRQ